jgi:DtxR family Mn-dependent transcriptional regulator
MTGLLWWMAVTVLLLLGVLWPRQGLLARARQRASRRAREQGDNALKHLLQEAQAGRAGTFASLKGTLHLGDRAVLRVMERLRASALTASEGGSYRLTTAGEKRARHLVRAHRLLERYLADEARLPLTAVHRVAERLEHRLTEAEADRLSASLGHPERDPHGDPIPSAGEGTDDSGVPITAWTTGQEGRIVHLEDEPVATFSALVQLGLQPGQAFRVLSVSDDAIGLLAEDHEVDLPLEHAGNVFAAPLEGWAVDATGLVRLSDLPVAQSAEIVSLSPTCQGFTRRRLLDLGFTPGTRVQPLLQTFAGDPRAYRVRGTTIALRSDQSSAVIVKLVPSDATAQDRRRPRSASS